MKEKFTIWVYRCPNCGRFTNEESGWIAYGEHTGEMYIYCDFECYEEMEFPYYLQEQCYHEE